LKFTFSEFFGDSGSGTTCAFGGIDDDGNVIMIDKKCRWCDITTRC